MARAPLRLVAYRGRSMAGTFAAGDLLRVAPLDGPPRPGEIIVFRDAAGARVVHRVAARLDDGRLRTRGDAHAAEDDAPVPLARVEGRVVGVVRPPPPRALRPHAPFGLAGRAYRALARQAWLRAALRRLIRPELRRLRFDTGGGEVIKLVHRGRTIAWIHPQTGRMRTRAPWALLIDPPAPPAGAPPGRTAPARADRG